MIKTIKENKNYKKNSAKTDKNKQNKEKKSQQISNRENNTKKGLNCFLIFDWNVFLSSIPSLKSDFFYAVTSNKFVF